MMRLSIALLVGLAAALAVALGAGGAVGTGVLVGYGAGAGLAALGSLLQAHTLARRPGRLLSVLAVAFLAKLALLLLGALAFRFIPAAAERVDWRSFVVAFGAAVALVLPFGTMDAARALRSRAVSGATHSA